MKCTVVVLSVIGLALLVASLLVPLTVGYCLLAVAFVLVAVNCVLLALQVRRARHGRAA